jgi:selenophosphate synthase
MEPMTKLAATPALSVRMPEYSNGSGGGCKITPGLLENILKSTLEISPAPRLRVGNASKDDAAVHDLREGSGVGAVPRLPQVEHYLAPGCSPGGAQRNIDSYGHRTGFLETTRRQLLCDPQTSAGLLVAAVPECVEAFLPAAVSQALNLQPIGDICACAGGPRISVR